VKIFLFAKILFLLKKDLGVYHQGLLLSTILTPLATFSLLEKTYLFTLGLVVIIRIDYYTLGNIVGNLKQKNSSFYVFRLFYRNHFFLAGFYWCGL